ncbi:ABC transporter substrate-binding protein [Rhodococcus sp. SJ-2]
MTTAVMLWGVSGCGTSTGSDDPVGTVDTDGVINCGISVSPGAPIERAVAVNQPAVELLLSLGLADRLSGLALGDDRLLPELEPEASEVYRFDTEFPSFESVLDCEPDFVYTTFDYTFSDEGIADRDRFTEMGISTYQSPSECTGQDAVQDSELTLDDLYAEILDVSTLFDVRERGEDLVGDLRGRAETAAGSIDASQVTLAWWYAGTTSPYIAGCCGAPGIMTRAVGAQNAFGDSRQLWPEVGWESILDRDPTVLVLADLTRGSDGDSAEEKIRFLESDPVASRLTAVQNKRYIVLGGTTMDPSIRNISGIEQLATGLRELGVA